MFKLVYKRLVANVIDVRYFKHGGEIADWVERQCELEPFDVVSLEWIEDEPK